MVNIMKKLFKLLPKEQFAGIELVEGMSLYGTGEHGETVQVVVKSFNDAEVTIDYNHPMAGRTLMFSVAILSLRDATEEEIQTGVVGGMAAMGGGCCVAEVTLILTVVVLVELVTIMVMTMDIHMVDVVVTNFCFITKNLNFAQMYSYIWAKLFFRL